MALPETFTPEEESQIMSQQVVKANDIFKEPDLLLRLKIRKLVQAEVSYGDLDQAGITKALKDETQHLEENKNVWEKLN